MKLRTGLICYYLVVGSVCVVVWMEYQARKQDAARVARAKPHPSAANNTPHMPTPAELTPMAAGIVAFNTETNIVTAKEGTAQAHFTFFFTNLASKEVVVTSVQASCGCTTAELPPMPWKVPAHASSRIPITMNIGGYIGTNTKTVTVSTLKGYKDLTLQVIVTPTEITTNMTEREKNQVLARRNRQAVLMGDCARCHAEPLRGKMGKDLYVAACGICHDASPRAAFVPNLAALNRPTDYNYWKVFTSAGVTIMPGFGERVGGPLTAEQIDSLAKYLLVKFPSRTTSAQGDNPVSRPSRG